MILELESNDHALRALKLAHEKNFKPKINLFSLPLGALELGTPSEDSGGKDDQGRKFFLPNLFDINEQDEDYQS